MTSRYTIVQTKLAFFIWSQVVFKVSSMEATELTFYAITNSVHLSFILLWYSLKSQLFSFQCYNGTSIVSRSVPLYWCHSCAANIGSTVELSYSDKMRYPWGCHPPCALIALCCRAPCGEGTIHQVYLRFKLRCWDRREIPTVTPSCFSPLRRQGMTK